jgi:hypothetical protein
LWQQGSLSRVLHDVGMLHHVAQDACCAVTCCAVSCCAVSCCAVPCRLRCLSTCQWVT